MSLAHLHICKYIYMARRYYYFAEKQYSILFQKKHLYVVGNVFLRINTAQSISNY